jgi:hypothetical protein
MLWMAACKKDFHKLGNLFFNWAGVPSFFLWTIFLARRITKPCRSINHVHCRAAFSFSNHPASRWFVSLWKIETHPPTPSCQIIPLRFERSFPFVCGTTKPNSQWFSEPGLRWRVSPTAADLLHGGGGEYNLSRFLCSQQNRSGPGPDTTGVGPPGKKVRDPL